MGTFQDTTVQQSGEDENKLGALVTRNPCHHEVLYFTYNCSPRDKYLVMSLPMNLDEFYFSFIL